MLRRFGRGLAPACFAAFLALAAQLPAVAALAPPLEAQAAELDQLRQQCVAAAAGVQRRERTVGALDLAIGVMQSGVDAKNQDITTGRREQEQLLGALERLARAPPEALAFAPEGPVDRLRSGILIGAAIPALSARARELAGQLAALANVRNQIDTRRKDIDDARAALAKGRDAVAQLVARRNALIAQMLHDDGKTAPPPLGDQGSDLFDLIKKADAATDQRDKGLLARLRMLYTVPGKPPPNPADPTKPRNLRALDAPHAEMLWPVSGELVHRFGEADKTGRPSQGIAMQSMPNGLVVAPFDGRVEYAGPFRSLGLILIIRHPGGYHSLLAGLGRIDVTMGQWLLAGEPVGSLPGAEGKDASANFYLELRREGRPVDPQSRLGSRDQKTEDSRVHQ